MDSLPVEILGEIAAVSPEAYRAMCLIRQFAAGLSPGVIVDWQIHFGYSCNITAESISWLLNGKLHRIDGPAVIYPDGGHYSYRISKLGCGIVVCPDGTQCWYRNGNQHRDDGPAVVQLNGVQFWYRDGQRHRRDAPACIYPDDNHQWYQNGEQHRDDGPAVINDYGQFWYRYGKRHRDDGPASIHRDGTHAWYQNGERHRVDGPAVVWANGLQRWYLNGKLVPSPPRIQI